MVGQGAKAAAVGLVGQVLCLCAGVGTPSLEPLEALLVSAVESDDISSAAEAAAAIAEGRPALHSSVLTAMPRLRKLAEKLDLPGQLLDVSEHVSHLLDAAENEVKSHA